MKNARSLFLPALSIAGPLQFIQKQPNTSGAKETRIVLASIRTQAHHVR